MKKIRLKQPVVYAIYGVSFLLLLGFLYLISPTNNTLDIEENINYVSKSILEDVEPVISTDQRIIKPYTDESVTLLKNFYDYDSEEETQKNAIIYYQNTYMQSSGVAYGKSDKFDIVAVLDGTVTSIKEDELLGTIVEIKHDDNTFTLYQSIADVKVKENDTVTQGTIIGTSGTSNLQKDLGQHIYFELIKNNTPVNPENCYGKTLKELQG